MDLPADQSTSTGSGVPRPRTEQPPYLNPEVPPNRWRCPIDRQAFFTCSQAPGGRPAPLPIVELLLVEEGPGESKFVVVTPNGIAPAPVLAFPTEFERVRNLCVPVPRLLPRHDGIGCFSRISGVVFSGAPQPRDIRQGQLGSCRTASALQALAAAPKGPAYIQTLIKPADGGFLVKLRPTPRAGKAGRVQPPVWIFVDDFLPVEAATGNLLYCLRGSVKAGVPAAVPLWPAVVEKALATMWGSYGELEAFEMHEDLVFRALGCSVQTLPGNLSGKLSMMQQMGSGEITAGQIQAFLQAVAAQGAAITCPGMAIQHNYAIVQVLADGVVIADPRTAQTADAWERWLHPNRAKLAIQEFLNDPDVWPVFFTWEQLLRAIRWVCAYKIPDF